MSILIPETKAAQYLYKDDSFAYFMDTSTYETVSIPKDVIGSYVNFLKEGDSILMLTYEGKILSIKENPSVVWR